MSQPIRVFLVASEKLFRDSVAQALGRRRHLRIFGQAGLEPGAMAEARSANPDIVVVDPQVGGSSSTPRSSISEVRAQVPDAAVVVVSADARPATVARAVQEGARAYLQKECSVEELTQAIDRVHSGEVVLLSRHAQAAGRGLFPDDLPNNLTRRESELLPLIAEGYTNHQIAQALCITEHTVKAHLANTLRKLGLSNRTQLAAFTAKSGLDDHREVPVSA